MDFLPWGPCRSILRRIVLLLHECGCVENGEHEFPLQSLDQ
ncbi:hypothetical protein M758_10G019200 [Ceratodon purpureus]|nr:hypothetical protein M758_10G019200 [Ceratodon purpureus]